MNVSRQTVCTGHFTAREKVLVFIELEAGWVLELVWMFCCSLVPTEIRTPDLPAYILVIILNVLHCTGLKKVQKGCIDKMRWEVWIGCFCLLTGILGRLF